MDSKTPRKLKICFVWPSGFLKSFSIPLPFAYLKANLDPNLYDLLLVDCAKNEWTSSSPEFIELLQKEKPDVLGVSSWSPMFPEALGIFRTSKQINPNCVTILGGAHATTYYKAVMTNPEIDYVMRGEAEHSFPRFLKAISEDSPKFTDIPGIVFREGNGLFANEPERKSELDEIVAPDFSFIDLKTYNQLGYRWNSPNVPNAPLWVTRGCPYRCQYCSSPQLNGKEIRKHSIQYMMSQIVELYHHQNIRWFNIIDDNFTFDVEFAKEFCRSVIALNLPKIGFGTPNGIRMSRGDKELWGLMKKAGWRQIIIAPESGSQHTLALMKKDLKLGIVPEKVKEMKSVGLKVQAFFIVGYPGETVEDIEETFRLIRKCKFNFIFLANFHPIPGTPVYQQLVQSGEIKDGLLPNNFSDGIRAYTPKNLEQFHFGRFFFRTHFMLMWSYPQNIPYHLKVIFRMFPSKMIFEKLYKLARSFFISEKKKAAPQAFWSKGMHFQNQSINP